MRVAFPYVLFFTVSLLLTACGAAPTYSAYRSLPPTEWADSEVVRYEVDTLAPGTYDVSVTVRSSLAHSYPYKSLALQLTFFATERSADTLAHAADTTQMVAVARDSLVEVKRWEQRVSLPVARVQGEPYGRGLSLHDEAHYVGTLTLNDSVAGHFALRHLMHSHQVSGIAALGLYLQRR